MDQPWSQVVEQMIDRYKLGMNFNLEALEHASWTAGAILLLVWCDLFQWFLILSRVIFGEVKSSVWVGSCS